MGQLSNPTHTDWVSQVQLEIKEIVVMSKDQYKSVIKEAVYHKAFLDLLKSKRGRRLENAKGKKIIYTEFKLAEYVCP